MEKYFIYAYPHMYGGLHGMYDWDIVEGTYEDATYSAHELALQVIDDFGLYEQLYSEDEYRVDNDIPDDEEIDWDDYHKSMEDLIEEEASFEVYKIKDGVNIEEIRQCNDDPHTIIEKYCI